MSFVGNSQHLLPEEEGEVVRIVGPGILRVGVEAELCLVLVRGEGKYT